MEKIGKYDIVEELGRGGMGVVYRAHDPVIGRDVAIKLVLEQALSNPVVRERFYREARSAGRLSHDNITIIYDVNEEDDKPYLVMELLDGYSLRELMDAAQPIPLAKKLDVAAQICQGLNYAHKHGIIHRDIKPDNVQVLENGRAKLMDFGIARIGDDASRLTKTDTSIGTPRYMSPEQIRGDELDGRADIFSFGILFYELLTGINPFQGDHITTIIYKVLHEEPDPVNIEPERVGKTLQPIIEGLLAKNPDERYQTFGEVLYDLRQLSVTHDNTLIRSMPDEKWAPAATTIREAQEEASSPHKLRAALWVVAVLLVAGFGAVGYVMLRPEPALETVPLAEESTTPPPPFDVLPLAAEDSADAEVTPTEETDTPDAIPTTAETPPEVDPNQAPAQQMQRAAEQARRRVEGQQGELAVAGLWRRGENELQTGRQQFNAGNFGASLQAFRAARDLYQEMQQTLIQLAEQAQQETPPDSESTDPPETTSTGDVADADRSRSAMQTIKQTVAAALTSDPEYQRAQSLEQQGQAAYDRRAYDQASTYFRDAGRLYGAVASRPSPQELASRAVQSYVQRLRSGFENEDTDALRSLNTFYQSWGSFFDSAEDIEATVRPGTVQATAAQATVSVQIQLNYKDNKNRNQSTAFTHLWTLMPQGDIWALTSVSAQ